VRSSSVFSAVTLEEVAIAVGKGPDGEAKAAMVRDFSSSVREYVRTMKVDARRIMSGTVMVERVTLRLCGEALRVDGRYFNKDVNADSTGWYVERLVTMAASRTHLGRSKDPHLSYVLRQSVDALSAELRSGILARIASALASLPPLTTGSRDDLKRLRTQRKDRIRRILRFLDKVPGVTEDELLEAFRDHAVKTVLEA
jgi:hypothetical protein